MKTFEEENQAKTSKPRWINGLPAWDITLSNSEVHEGVTDKDILSVLWKLHIKGVIDVHDCYPMMITQREINYYNKFFTEISK